MRFLAAALAPGLFATGVLATGILATGVVATPARAASTHAAVSLLAASTDAVAGQSLHLGLRVALAPGWHTYWSNPGDAGLPPAVTVAQDGGAPAAATLRFPAPARIGEGGLVGYGYTGTVVLPFDVTVPPGTAPLALAVHADLLVCSNVCVPATADLAGRFPRGTVATASPEAGALARAVAALPQRLPVAATLAADGVLRVADPAIAPATVAHAFFFPDASGLIDADAAEPLDTGAGVLRLRLKPAAGLAAATAPVTGVLSLTDRNGDETAIAIAARRVAAGAAAPATAVPSPWLLASLAVAGGLLLNLMPCVFPVLALKALALARAADGGERGARQRSALLYAAGTVGGLLALGGALLALRAAGSAVAWGFQFQSPPVVAATALLLAAVGFNLLGVFEITAGRLAGAGGRFIARGGAGGDVLAGVLAVLVATPCTAPFMGAALAGALAGPVAGALLVFACLGLGLALPMLLLGLAPGLGRLLPRPGAWMETLRQVLAFPMFAAVLWLLWLVSVEAGPSGVLALGAALLLLGLAAWAFGRGGRAAAPVAALALVCALAIVPLVRLAPAGTAAPLPAGLAGAEPYSADRLASLRAAGRPVLVDMGAAWCLTCLVNERVAFGPDAVHQAMASRGVVLMHGDWTRRDPAISSFLHRFEREGVPLAVYFAPDGEATVLPQVLTAGDVLHAIGGTG